MAFSATGADTILTPRLCWEGFLGQSTAPVAQISHTDTNTQTGVTSKKRGAGRVTIAPLIDHPSEDVLTLLVKSFILRLAVEPPFATPIWTSSFHKHTVSIQPSDIRETKGLEGRTRSPDANAFAASRRQKQRPRERKRKSGALCGRRKSQAAHIQAL